MAVSGSAGWIRQINRLQKQFRYILDFDLVSDTKLCDGLIELSGAIRTRCGDYPRTGPDRFFDTYLSEAFFSDPVLPWPAAAAAAAEAPLPVVLHFNQCHPWY